jgi:hypothetical protein
MSMLPNSMMYASRKIPAVQASSILRSFSASNGTTFTTSTNEIRIPVNCDGFLDGSKSYLQFTINNSGGNTAGLDPYGLCWADQLRIESNGQVLERVERAGVYDTLRRRWTKGQKAITKMNVVAGGPAPGGASVPNDGKALATTNTLTLAMDLPLGFLNSHHGRAVPKGASFDLVIRVNSTLAECFKFTNAATAFSIDTPRFYAPVFQIEDAQVMDDYSAALMERGISWSGDSVKSYVNAVAAGAGTKTLQINDRSNSLKGLITVLRDNATIAAFDGNSIGHSTIKGITQVRTSIAGRNYPPDNIQVQTVGTTLDVARLYTECSKVLAPEGELEADPAVVEATYAGLTQTEAQGVIAVDLKHFDDVKLMMVGLNTASNNSPSTIELQCDGASSACEAVSYALCEAVWTLDSRGQLSVAI